MKAESAMAKKTCDGERLGIARKSPAASEVMIIYIRTSTTLSLRYRRTLAKFHR